jgi:hypothetical protein
MPEEAQGHAPPSDNPPWLYLLDPMNLGWREKQILKGRNPDPYIERQLVQAGVWPPKGAPSA